jgi:Fic family protein
MTDTGTSSRHVEGLVEVMHAASENFAIPLDEDRLCRWQSALFPGGTSGISRIETGRFRTFAEPMQIVSGRIGKEKVHFRAPDSTAVPAEIAAFLDWFNRSTTIDGIVRAGLAHLWFETIHPFEDGNGRIGRAIIDLALAQDAGHDLRLYSMSRQLEQNKAAYYDALNAAQTGNMDVTAWLTWFATQFSQACEKSGHHIDQAILKSRFWHEQSAEGFNERQRKVLKRLLEAGDGGFLGGLTAEKYSKMTGASKATATRDLGELLQNGLLKVHGTGRATKYQIAVPGWEHVERSEHIAE